MPDVQEVFRMATQKVKPDPGALDRQFHEQRRKTTRRKVAAYAVAAAIVVAFVSFAAILRQPPERERTGGPPSQQAELRPSIVGLDGTIREVGVDLPEDAWGLALSPDGTEIAYVTWDLNVGFCGQCTPGPRIAAVGMDGSNSRFLTLHKGDLLHDVSQPAWSPDGSRVAFVGGEGDDAEIFQVDARGEHLGAHPRRLTFNDTEDANPTWSPEGDWIVYDNSGTTPLDDSLLSPTADIWAVPARGTSRPTPTRATSTPGSDRAPDIATDGRLVVSHGSQLAANGLEGGPPTLLLEEGGYTPRWSPDGTKIAFLQFHGHRAEVLAGDEGVVDLPMLSVVILDVATGEVTTLPVEVATALNGVSWLPSSDALLVNRLN